MPPRKVFSFLHNIQPHNNVGTMALYDPNNKPTLLTQQEEIELFQRIHAGDQTAVQTVIEKNMGFVHKLGGIYAKKMSLEERESLGVEGLLNAIRLYDERLGLKFCTYAGHWIRSALQKGVHAWGGFIGARIPNYVATDVYPIFADMIERGITPTVENVRLKMTGKYSKMKSETLQEILDYFNTTFLGLDDIIPMQNNSSNTFKEAIEDERSLQFVGDVETADEASRALEYLTTRQRDVVVRYFGLEGVEQEDLTRISKRWGVSKTRIGQIVQEALESMREGLQDNKPSRKR